MSIIDLVQEVLNRKWGLQGKKKKNCAWITIYPIMLKHENALTPNIVAHKYCSATVSYTKKKNCCLPLF